MVSPKDDMRYSSERVQSDRYYEDRSGHYYREVRDERDYMINNGNGTGNLGRHSQEPTESDRGNYLQNCKCLLYSIHQIINENERNQLYIE